MNDNALQRLSEELRLETQRVMQELQQSSLYNPNLIYNNDNNNILLNTIDFENHLNMNNINDNSDNVLYGDTLKLDDSALSFNPMRTNVFKDELERVNAQIQKSLAENELVLYGDSDDCVLVSDEDDDYNDNSSRNDMNNDDIVEEVEEDLSGYSNDKYIDDDDEDKRVYVPTRYVNNSISSIHSKKEDHHKVVAVTGRYSSKPLSMPSLSSNPILSSTNYNNIGGDIVEEEIEIDNATINTNNSSSNDYYESYYSSSSNDPSPLRQNNHMEYIQNHQSDLKHYDISDNDMIDERENKQTNSIFDRNNSMSEDQISVKCNSCGRHIKTMAMTTHKKVCRLLLKKKSSDNRRTKSLHNIRKRISSAPVRSKFANSAPVNIKLEPCFNCGRTFLPERLKIHVRSCEKVFGNAPINNNQNQNQHLKKLNLNKKHCKICHHEIINHHCKNCTNLNKPKSSSIRKISNRSPRRHNLAKSHNQNTHEVLAEKANRVERVPCPYCNRSFSLQAADRHIDVCKNVKSKPLPIRRGQARLAYMNTL